MVHKIWTENQLALINQMIAENEIPADVGNEVKRVVDILDTYYSKERDVENDDGGYVLLFTECLNDDEEIQQCLDKYHVRLDDVEYQDEVCDCGGLTWKSALYLVTNEYGITAIYPTEEKGEN